MNPYVNDADHYWADEDEEGSYGGGLVTCRRCKQEDLTWHHTGVRWALLDENNKIHSCGLVAKADDFEDLTK